ncbi:hypothetical protein H8356DRAFT_1356159 [Neocallimastix lanati (nom. inval.)]|nr:hypothetical protein H8356DRAFT_1356159 [Neocallimastix sp. JGI-2020a]
MYDKFLLRHSSLKKNLRKTRIALLLLSSTWKFIFLINTNTICDSNEEYNEPSIDSIQTNMIIKIPINFYINDNNITNYNLKNNRININDNNINDIKIKIIKINNFNNNLMITLVQKNYKYQRKKLCYNFREGLDLKIMRSKIDLYNIINSIQNIKKLSIQDLIEQGADINKEKREWGNENLVQYLIDQRADINKESKYGETPLFNTCKSGNENLQDFSPAVHLSPYLTSYFSSYSALALLTQPQSPGSLRITKFSYVTICWVSPLKKLCHTHSTLSGLQEVDIGGIKWWKKRYRHREGSNQEPYALKAYADTEL